MPILEEKRNQHSTDRNSTGSNWMAWVSIAFWSLISPSHSRLSISIMHHWRGVDVKVSLLCGTGLDWSVVSDPLIIVWVGSFSSCCRSLARLCRSETGASLTVKSLPILKGCIFKSGPLKVLVSGVRWAELWRVMWHVIDENLPNYRLQANRRVYGPRRTGRLMSFSSEN